MSHSDQPISPQDDAAFRALRLIEQNPKLTQRELAQAAGISLGKAHYVISALIDRGYVKLERFSASKNKRAYMYILTPKGLARRAAIAGRFLSRKQKEYEALKREIEELSAEIASARDPK